MKKLIIPVIIVFFTLCCATQIFAASPDDLKNGFMGLKWGSAPSELKNGAKLSADDPLMKGAPATATVYQVENMDIAGITVPKVMYLYYNDQLMGVRWDQTDTAGMIKALSKVYGPPLVQDAQQTGWYSSESSDEMVSLACSPTTKECNVVNMAYLMKIMQPK